MGYTFEHAQRFLCIQHAHIDASIVYNIAFQYDWIITFTEEWPLDGLYHDIEWRLRQNPAPTLIAGYGFPSIHSAVSALYSQELSSHSGIRRIAMG